MGDEAERLFEQELMFGYQYDTCIFEERCREGIWTMRDGRCINIDDMETSHVRNSLNMIIRRQLEHLECYIPVFERVLEARKNGKKIL